MNSYENGYACKLALRLSDSREITTLSKNEPTRTDVDGYWKRMAFDLSAGIPAYRNYFEEI
jgi:hypothetical protein